MELPSHPNSSDTAPDQHPHTKRSWSTIVVVAVVATLFVGMVLLHLTGVVGPAGN